MIVRDLHIGNVEFDSIQLGENIRIEIKKSRFQINDPHILSIGQFLGRAGLGPSEAKGPSGPKGPEPKTVVEEQAEAVEEEEEEEEEESQTEEEEEGQGEEEPVKAT